MGIPKPNLRGLLEPKGLGPLAQFLEQDQVSWLGKVFASDNTGILQEFTDATAPVKRLYWSTTASKAAIKDAGGTPHYLW